MLETLGFSLALVGFVLYLNIVTSSGYILNKPFSILPKNLQKVLGGCVVCTLFWAVVIMTVYTQNYNNFFQLLGFSYVFLILLYPKQLM